MRKINPAAPIAALLLVNFLLYQHISKKPASEDVNQEYNHFRCDNAQPLNLVRGEQSCSYVGQSFTYSGVDSSRGTFYLNNDEFPINLDTLRIRSNPLSEVVNLFVVDNITSDSLRIRNVGHDRI